ncbi:hypothetical protein ACIBG8_33430 [Nonomuraea sp. NPDC050556]|uniref:hypothetical protein n=1 Tax=Nonomuraea sp. NPDC050556 TaxID=3364369 RepID=UPI0037A25981
MSALLAVLGVIASIAGVVQTVVVIIERAERKRRELPTSTSTPERSSASGRAERGKDVAVDVEPPWDPDVADGSWRSALAYLLGFVGGLIFRRDHRPNVRFHAVQSILIDIVAVAYFLITLILAGIYAAIRYQGIRTEIPSDDVVMWTWVLTFLLGPPALHLLLAALVLAGRRPRIPLLCKIAATITARPVKNTGRNPDPALSGASGPVPRHPHPRTEEVGPKARHMSTDLIEERPYEPTLHRGRRAVEAGCSWHGRTCNETVVASVLTRDKGGETWHAVCQRALKALRGS